MMLCFETIRALYLGSPPPEGICLVGLKIVYVMSVKIKMFGQYNTRFAVWEVH